MNGRIVPLHYRLKSGDFVEILTTKAGRGPSRDWMSLAASSRARNKIRQWFSRETREETEAKGRESLETALKQQNLPYKKLQGSAVLAQVIRETGFKKAEDFYLALGSGKLAARQIVNKVIQRLKTEEVAQEEAVPLKAPKARHAVCERELRHQRPRRRRRAGAARQMLHAGAGGRDRRLRLARQGDHDPPRGLPNVKALKRNPERFTNVSWDGGATQSFRVQIAVDSWDRPRLLEDVARTFAEHGANIVEYGGHVEDQLAKNWYVAEVGDVKALRSLLTALRNLDAVFDAYRDDAVLVTSYERLSESLDRGIIPRTSGVPRRRDGVFRDPEYNVREGEGLHQRAAALVRSEDGGRAPGAPGRWRPCRARFSSWPLSRRSAALRRPGGLEGRGPRTGLLQPARPRRPFRRRLPRRRESLPARLR